MNKEQYVEKLAVSVKTKSEDEIDYEARHETDSWLEFHARRGSNTGGILVHDAYERKMTPSDLESLKQKIIEKLQDRGFYARIRGNNPYFWMSRKAYRREWWMPVVKGFAIGLLMVAIILSPTLWLAL